MAMMSNGGNRARVYQNQNSRAASQPKARSNSDLDNYQDQSAFPSRGAPLQALNLSNSSFSFAPKSNIKSTPDNPRASAGTIDPVTQKLVIHNFKDEIVTAVQESGIVMIQGATGCGKTTWVPRFLVEAGRKVLLVQPRCLPTERVAEYGAKLDGTPLGEKIGFRHGHLRLFQPNNDVIYATEGHEFSLIIGTKTLEIDRDIIIDEAHEKSAYSTLLLAYLKMREAKGLENPNVLIMSANLEVEAMSDYLDSPTPIPVIRIEARKFPITELASVGTIAQNVAEYSTPNEGSLVFLYGKGAIKLQAEAIGRADRGIRTIPLHSQMSSAEQDYAFRHYPDERWCILATNTAQTSLTFEHVTRVISSGKVRRQRMLDGERALLVEDISVQELEQQFGRAGRVGPGEVVNAGKSKERLPLTIPPEIQNMSVAGFILRCAAADISFRELNSYSQYPVSEKQIAFDEAMLRNLKLFGSAGTILPLGEQVAKLPVEPRMGIMLIKALDYHKNEPAILDMAIDCAAVFEAEGIIEHTEPGDPGWTRIARGDSRSDALTQLSIFRKASQLEFDELPDNGVNKAKFLRASQIRTKIRERMGLEDEPICTKSFTEYQALLLQGCIWHGMMDCVFKRVGKGEYKSVTSNGPVRQLSYDSNIDEHSLIVAVPLTIGKPNGALIRTAQMANFVDSDWLKKNLTPELKRVFKENVRSLKKSEEFGSERKRAAEFHRPSNQRKGGNKGKNKGKRGR
jgi:HrpA-like RNA helicase